VNRPAYGAADASVTLTASITKGTVTNTKVFTLVIKAAENSGGSSVNPSVIIPSDTTDTADLSDTEDGEVTLGTDNNIHVIIEYIEENVNSTADYVLPISVEEVKKLISDQEVKGVVVSVLLPEDIQKIENQDAMYHFTIEPEVLAMVQDGDKALNIKVIDKDNKELYQWTFDQNNLDIMIGDKENLDLSLSVKDLSECGLLKEELDKENNNGFLISFGQNSILPVQTTVKVYVGNMEGVEPGNKVYVYRNNKETGKLEYLPYSSSYKIDEAGYITLHIIDASEYIVLNSKADATLTKSLLSQIKLNLSSRVLYTDNPDRDVAKFQVILPATLQLTDRLDKVDVTNSDTAIAAVSITYSSDNDSVASVDNTGIITAVGEGRALITAKITLYSGKTKLVKISVIVKDSE
jgi:hypothetical protein